MKPDQKSASARGGLCRGSRLAERARLLEAGYPKFLFRLAAARRAWVEMPGAPRRRD